MICPNCGDYFKMDSFQKAKLILDVDSCLELDSNLHFQDSLRFPDYAEKAKKDIGDFEDQTNLLEFFVPFVDNYGFR